MTFVMNSNHSLHKPIVLSLGCWVAIELHDLHILSLYIGRQPLMTAGLKLSQQGQALWKLFVRAVLAGVVSNYVHV